MTSWFTRAPQDDIDARAVAATAGSNIKSLMQGGHTPMETQRSCTDIIFIPIFLAALGGLAYCINYGMETGNLKRLTAMPDYAGNLCGTEGRGQYLYFCVAAGSASGEVQLNLQQQICVESCPVDTSVGMACPEGTQPSYPTEAFAGMLCMPGSSALKEHLKDTIGRNPFLQTCIAYADLFQDTEPLMIALVVSSLLAFAYLFLISMCAKVLLNICLAVSILVPACAGGFLVYEAETNYYPPMIHGMILGTGDQSKDLTTGVVCCVVAAIILCVALVKANAIGAALDSVEEAAECIFGMPVLVVEPWVSFLIRALVAVPGILGFLLLNMAGDTVNQVDLTSSGPVYKADSTVVVCLIYYVIVFIWIMELLHAFSQWVVIYTAQVWYFRQKEANPSCWSQFSGVDMLSAFCDGIRFHLGSLLYGSFLSTLFRAFRIFASALVYASDSTGNPVAECIARIFACCVTCAEQVMQYVTNMAYMDIALNSSSYCGGVGEAIKLLASDASTFAAVEGIAVLFSIAGVGVVAAGTGAFTWMLCEGVSRYSDPTSHHFVEDPSSLIGITTVIGAIMSLPFMHLFDTIADTMFFCKAIEKQNPSSQVTSMFGSLFG
eukprot:TRINITY_DN24472_c0_g1_i1.p1 TRINITY_DN24472_c0_g1~~TRINITY_DN24472_c0_g1_i1.p1  ORF type:complete len:607 (-),score=89.30 TRINITY_DN24472_c0_g1_i1:291-2111(-)